MSQQFVLLPAEIRLKIWDEALDNEMETRFILYYGMGGHVLHTYVDERAVIFPHRELRSTLLVVNHESRQKALRFFHVKLPVHNCPQNLRMEMSRCPREAMDNLPESPAGFVYIRPERETVIYNMEFNIYEDWPLKHLVGVSTAISVAIREKFRRVWIVAGCFAWVVSETACRRSTDEYFEKLLPFLTRHFPYMDTMTRLKELQSRALLGALVIDRILQKGFPDVLRHYAGQISVLGDGETDLRALVELANALADQ